MQIEHVVVLMMENRSFDHFFGYLNHKSPKFVSLTGNEWNPDIDGNPVKVSNKADYITQPGPGHKYADVWQQLYDGANPKINPATNSGFVKNYQKKGGNYQEVMDCFSEGKIPILSNLALQYAICTRWFCSVPGPTWPNRLFAHMGHSDRTIKNKKKFYRSRNIFDLLDDHRVRSEIFVHGPAQVMTMPSVWGKIHDMESFFKKAETGTLPSYSFIEPDHLGDHVNNFHPNYIKTNSGSFLASERLIARIYNALIFNKSSWRKTMFIITFDEHGGYFDRESPPKAIPPKRPRMKDKFDFDRLGPRVPAIIISPWIKKGYVDDTEYDHTSIIRTLRWLFAKDSEPLAKRDAKANPILGWEILKTPRLSVDPIIIDDEKARPRSFYKQPAQLDDFQKNLIALNEDINKEIAARSLKAMSMNRMDIERTLKSVTVSQQLATHGDIRAYLRDRSAAKLLMKK